MFDRVTQDSPSDDSPCRLPASRGRAALVLACYGVALVFFAGLAHAQTTAFTFQGRLSEKGAPANGGYDLQLELFDTNAVGTGTQIGSTIAYSNVQVTSGVFTVQVDFSANAFPGTDRFLQVAVKPAGTAEPFTVLNPRQPITPTPYSIRSVTANAADTATTAATAGNASQLGGVAANDYVLTSDSRLSDARPPSPGSSNYIQNTTTPQAANFSISGSGAITGNLGVGEISFADGSLQQTAGISGVGIAGTLPLWATPGRLTFTTVQVFDSGNMSLGFAQNQHWLSIGGGPIWTSNSWIGSLALPHASAIGWNGTGSGGQQFGIGRSQGGLYFFRSFSPLGTTGSAANYDMVISEEGKVGIGTTTPAFPLDVAGGIRSTSSIVNGTSGITCATSTCLDVTATGGGPAAQFSIGSGATRRGAVLALTTAAAGFVGGSTFITGDSTPLPSNFGKGIVMGFGAGGTAGYISAFDYGAFVPQTLLLNNSGGRVGIGTSAPDQTLTVNGNASKPAGGSWATFSDERLKKINGPFTPGLKAIMQMEPVRYEYTSDNALNIRSEGEHIGFGAHAVEKIIPEAVSETDDGYLLVNNDPIIWTMLNGIKEQQKQIDQLKAEVRRLRAASRAKRK